MKIDYTNETSCSLFICCIINVRAIQSFCVRFLLSRRPAFVLKFDLIGPFENFSHYFDLLLDLMVFDAELLHTLGSTVTVWKIVRCS